jgi:hypothetical protein
MFHSSDLTQALDTPALTRHITMRCQGSDTGRLDIGPAFIETTTSGRGDRDGLPHGRGGPQADAHRRGRRPGRDVARKENSSGRGSAKCLLAPDGRSSRKRDARRRGSSKRHCVDTAPHRCFPPGHQHHTRRRRCSWLVEAATRAALSLKAWSSSQPSATSVAAFICGRYQGRRLLLLPRRLPAGHRLATTRASATAASGLLAAREPRVEVGRSQRKSGLRNLHSLDRRSV